MKNHTDFLNYIAKETHLENYLEIGICKREHNFNKIDIGGYKISVDPDPAADADFPGTSDRFFRFFDDLPVYEDAQDGERLTFGLFWIDGNHEEEQVQRDINNCIRYANHGAIIGLHDCNPPTEATACYPRGSQREWCGTTFKAVVRLRSLGMNLVTVNADYGCMFIRVDRRMKGINFADGFDITWKEFDANRKELLNLVTVDEFKEWVKKA